MARNPLRPEWHPRNAFHHDPADVMVSQRVSAGEETWNDRWFLAVLQPSNPTKFPAGHREFHEGFVSPIHTLVPRGPGECATALPVHANPAQILKSAITGVEQFRFE